MTATTRHGDGCRQWGWRSTARTCASSIACVWRPRVCVSLSSVTPLSRAKLPQGNGRTLHANLRPYNEALRLLAAELKAPLIDVPVMMVERGIKLGDLVQEDGIHLTRQGNHLYAAMVFDRLQELFKRIS